MEAGNKRKRPEGAGAPGSRPRHAGKGPRGAGAGAGSSSSSGHYAPEKATAREAAEIRKLEERIQAEMPAAGSVDVEATEFAQLPISRYTMSGLGRGKFRALTAIQRLAIPHALAGRDILGAAKTGSGKTLAFLVPVLEKLYRLKWAAGDGLGAVVISPTRELAMQIFEVLRAVGQGHGALAVGLVTGGKDFAEEQGAVARMSILVATPGRLLQHLEQTPDLDASNVAVLVLDEADRLLDMGFTEDVNAILKYLPPPPQRQTLLFSATQTKSVKDLARLSLSHPEYVSVHDKAESVTPARLSQHYVVCPLQDKINLLYSFIRSHLQSKTIVFLSSCKQSRFIFEAFRRLRPGVPLQVLHGKMKQTRRMLVYYDFAKKSEAVLFATDIAARGLDFPDVDWVLQLDCPEDAQTYIHRVGRTARFRAKGHALLVLTPTEAPGMLPVLSAARIPISQTHIAQSAAVSVAGKLAAEVAADSELKSMAQKAYTSYARSVYLQPNKEVFKVQGQAWKDYGESLGLAVIPELKFRTSSSAGGAGAGAGSGSSGEEEEEEGDEGGEEEDVVALRREAHARKNQNKALARLKAKIAEEKAKKRAAKAGSGSSGGSGSSDGDDDDSDESSSSDDNDVPAARPRGAGAGAKAAAVSAKGRSTKSASAAAKDDDDELLRPKARDAMEVEEDGGGDGAGDGLGLTPEQLAKLPERDRARVFRVIQDTRELAAGLDDGRAGPDGLTPFQRIALAKAAEVGSKAKGAGAGAGAGTGTAATAGKPGRVPEEDFAAKIAARLASTSARDREHERERVRAKHREEKLRAKGRGDELDAEEDGEDGGVQLAMPEGGYGDEEENEDEDAGDGSGDESMSSSGSSSSDEEEEDDGGRGAKRRRREEGGEPSGAPKTVSEMEALAQELLARKRGGAGGK
jgi:ATP-dependent RNA helicase DDX10/DBP4